MIGFLPVHGFMKRQCGRGFRNGTEAEELVAQRGKEVTVTCQGNERFLPSFVRVLFALGTLHVEESEHMRRVYGEAEIRQRGLLEGVYERWK